ncbi:MAG: DNA gyrase C-terminal beta-propeller domain-containing protein [Thermoleophilaceae bacterium]
MLATRDYAEDRYLVFATKQGIVKKTEFAAYNTPMKADGIIAINIRDDDELVAVRRTSGDDDIIMVSRSGQAIRFDEAQARPMGRDTSGVRGMNISRGDNEVLAMDIARDDTELLVVTENGFGKRTSIADYPQKGRGGMGVQTIRLTERKGGVAGALIVHDRQELLFISQEGMVQRTSVGGISRYGRSSQGVRLMNMREGDRVSAVALVVEDSGPDAPVDGEEPSRSTSTRATTPSTRSPTAPARPPPGRWRPPWSPRTSSRTTRGTARCPAGTTAPGPPRPEPPGALLGLSAASYADRGRRSAPCAYMGPTRERRWS